MTRISIPQNKDWRGINQGEFFGTIYHAKCIDLERNKGKVCIGESLSDIFDIADDTDLTTPVAFVRTAADTTDRWWALGGKLFKTTNTNPEVGWTQDAIASSPTAPLWDMKEFGDSLYVAQATDIAKLTAGTWTASWWSGLTGELALTTGVPHRMAIFAGALLITNGRYINTYDGTLFTLDATKTPGLTLPSDFEAQFVLTTADYAWFPCNNTTGGEAEVFVWDRASATFNARYGIGDSSVLAGFVVSGIPYLITKKGEIKRFTGQGFRTVQQFPNVELQATISDINPNGVVVDENVVRILVNFGANTSMRTISGIWNYNVDTNNLYHCNSIKNDIGKDYSQQEISAVGAMALTLPTQGRYLVGAKAYKVYTGTTVDAIYSFDESSTSNRAYLITSKIASKNIKNFWKGIWPRFKNLLSSNDRIRLAYRIAEPTTLAIGGTNNPETITWATATTFTGSNATATVGDFVEVIAGDGAGLLAKIITKTGASAPYTFTIDVGITAATTAARARYLNFTDLGTISTQGISDQIFRIAKKSGWIQFLIELRGDETSPELEEILLEYSDKQL